MKLLLKWQELDRNKEVRWVKSLNFILQYVQSNLDKWTAVTGTFPLIRSKLEIVADVTISGFDCTFHNHYFLKSIWNLGSCFSISKHFHVELNSILLNLTQLRLSGTL